MDMILLTFMFQAAEKPGVTRENQIQSNSYYMREDHPLGPRTSRKCWPVGLPNEEPGCETYSSIA